MEILKDEQAAVYTGFLNTKGRTIADAIIVRPKVYFPLIRSYKDSKTVAHPENEYWVDVHSDLAGRLRDHLKKYAWKKKVELGSIDSRSVQVYAVYVSGRQLRTTRCSWSQTKLRT